MKYRCIKDNDFAVESIIVEITEFSLNTFNNNVNWYILLNGNYYVIGKKILDTCFISIKKYRQNIINKLLNEEM